MSDTAPPLFAGKRGPAMTVLARSVELLEAGLGRFRLYGDRVISIVRSGAIAMRLAENRRLVSAVAGEDRPAPVEYLPQCEEPCGFALARSALR